MPELDGVGVLEALARAAPSRPRVVVVTSAEEDSELGLRALDAGAFDLVHKPTALATDRLYELSRELVDKVIAAGREPAPETYAAAAARAVDAAPRRRPDRPRRSSSRRLDGGPRAVSERARARCPRA